MSRRVDVARFEALYRADPDPWGFEHRWYEQRKYDLTVAALPRPRYRRGFEPGCSFGVLSERLAARCDALVTLEPVGAVAERARRRLATLDHVEVREGALPEHWPRGPLRPRRAERGGVLPHRHRSGRRGRAGRGQPRR